ncbi:tautomerase family protein [Acetivibrio mesophilus]|uniref:4-oxalocrotonate tautomerase n=1 Tax=Acetivibrio mesophilus TaxID=2487273 RepID=A0A4V1K2F6_9FIRM|nr:tautomerase family protein [Acetivibrio mesophilus]ODM25535.1 4-oxalocrotonate tautomerase [Clostridium sp. Bc-iso-3]RXE60119.1 4-oxalocrotonate tautomerase [Acetivibrio mesophilus]HHV29124.1 4-oxalocrotonate tautomerase [Clostridium sp.]
MPHVIVKLWPGRTEDQKIELANRIARDVVETLNASETSVSVSIEEVPREKWNAEVYKPDIMEKGETLYIKPGYKPED